MRMVQDRGPEYRRVRQLVDTALDVRPARAINMRARLLGALNSVPEYNLTLIAVERIQQRLAATSDAVIATRSVNLLIDVMRETGSSQVEHGGRFVEYDLEVLESLERMAQRAPSLERAKGPLLSQGYHNFISGTIPALSQGAEAGERRLLTFFGQDSDDEQRQEKIRNRQAWVTRLMAFKKDSRTKNNSAYRHDELLILHSSEPIPEFQGKKNLVDARYAGLTLLEVGRMDPKLSDEDFVKVTNYVCGVFLDERKIDPIDFVEMALELVPFDKDGEKVNYRYENLYKVLNKWQEKVLINLIQPEVPVTPEIKKLLEVMPKSAGTYLMTSLYELLIRTNSFRQVESRVTGDVAAEHPLFAYLEALYPPHRSGHLLEVYTDEIGEEALRQKIIPDLQKKIAGLGVGEKFTKGLALVQSIMEGMPFSESHFRAIIAEFEETAGTNFLDKLEKYRGELEDTTTDIWNDANQRGIQQLPLSSRISTVDFSENDTANVLGIADVSFQTKFVGENDWQIVINFGLKSGYPLIGYVDSNGSLVLKAPVKERAPGLYSILHGLSTAIIRDQVVVMEKESQSAGQLRKNGDTKTGDSSEQVAQTLSKGVKVKKAEGSEDVEETVTSDEMIKKVDKALGVRSRRVKMHRADLPGADAYRKAVENYSRLLVEGFTTDQFNDALSQLESAMSNFTRSTSLTKIAGLPKGWDLAEVVNPFSGERKPTKTWRVEHDNPKKQPGEVTSPRDLYDKYYRSASALAFFDALKPWLVEE